MLILLLFFLTVMSMPALHRALDETPLPRSRRALGMHLLALLGPAALIALALYAPALFDDPGSLVRGMALHRGIGPYQALPWPSLPSIRGVLHGETTFPQFLDGAMNACPAYALYVLAPVNALAIVLALRAGLPERPRVSLLVHTLLTTCIAAFILFSHFSRPDPAHTLPMTLFMLISLALPLWVLAQLRAIAPVGSTLLRWVMSLGILVIIVPALLAGIQGITSQWNQSLPTGTLAAPRIAGTATDPATATNYDALITYIKAHTTPNEPIFSGSTRHNLLAGNDVLLYFAAERQAGVRDYSMMPGITTRRDVQQRIVDDLQRNNVALHRPRRQRDSPGAKPEPGKQRRHPARRLYCRQLSHRAAVRLVLCPRATSDHHRSMREHRCRGNDRIRGCRVRSADKRQYDTALGRVPHRRLGGRAARRATGEAYRGSCQ